MFRKAGKNCLMTLIKAERSQSMFESKMFKFFTGQQKKKPCHLRNNHEKCCVTQSN